MVDCSAHYKGVGERMKYVVSVLLALVITVLTATAPASADKSDKEPNCGHFGGGIASGAGSYDAPTVNYAITTDGESCKNIEYTLHVLDADSATELAFQTLRGNETNEVRFSVPEIFSSSYEPVVCVYATSERGHRIVDRFPETGCVTPPSCADIIDGGPAVNAEAFIVVIGARSCSNVSYSLYIVVSPRVIPLGSFIGDGTSTQFSYSAPGAYPCVYATATTLDGQHIFDRAPDEGTSCDPGPFIQRFN